MAHKPNRVHLHGEDYQLGWYLSTKTSASSTNKQHGVADVISTINSGVIDGGASFGDDDEFVGGGDDGGEGGDDGGDDSPPPELTAEEDEQRNEDTAFVDAFMSDVVGPKLDASYKYPTISIMVLLFFLLFFFQLT